MQDALTWFEIPTIDLERARGFYEQVLATKLEPFAGGRDPLCLFPVSGDKVGGALVLRPNMAPSDRGSMVYLRLADEVNDTKAAEARVSSAGGVVVTPTMKIPGVPGELFVMKDTEGNVVGVHGV